MAKTGDVKAELREKIAKGEVILLVGSGVSREATEKTKVASWDGLIASGADWLDSRDPDSAELVRRDLPTKAGENQSAELTNKRLLLAAQVLKDALATAGCLAEWLEETVGKLQIDGGKAEGPGRELLMNLGALRVPIATTNYDHLLEKALNRLPVTIKETPECVTKWAHGRDDRILHIHGQFRAAPDCVISIADYAKTNLEPASEHMLRALLSLKSVLFVGCGDAGLTDPHFSPLLSWFRTTFPHKPPTRHYRLVTGSDQDWKNANDTHAADQHFLSLVRVGQHPELKSFLASIAPALTAPSGPSGNESALEDYRKAALPLVTELRMVGLAESLLRFNLDELFVPLSLDGSESSLGSMGAGHGARGDSGGPFQLDNLFAIDLPSPHLLILGDPGMGKTTAAMKIVSSVLHDGPSKMNFGERRPRAAAFVRLRNLRNEEIALVRDGEVEAWLRACVRGGRPESRAGLASAPPGAESQARLRAWDERESQEQRFATALSGQDPAIWVFDGLDEVATSTLRRHICAELAVAARRLAKQGRAVRLVMTSRLGAFASPEEEVPGEAPLREVLSRAFPSVRLRPLDPEHQFRLIRNWFQQLIRINPEAYEAERMLSLADSLQDELASDHRTSDRRFQSFAGTPLLTTFLCILKLKESSIPSRPGEIVSECIRVLLERRSARETGGRPILDPAMVYELLSPLAFRLRKLGHEHEFSVNDFGEHHDPLARKHENFPSDAAILHWLRNDAALITKTKEGKYLFAHGLIQEHFAAHQVRAEGSVRIRELAAELHPQSKWQEVITFFLDAAPPDQAEEFFAAALNGPLEKLDFAFLQRLVSHRPDAAATALAAELQPERVLKRTPGEADLIITLSRSAPVALVTRALRDLSHTRGLDDAMREQCRSAAKAGPAESSKAWGVFLAWSADQREAAEALAIALRESKVEVIGAPSSCQEDRYPHLARDASTGAESALLIRGQNPPPPPLASDMATTLRRLAQRNLPLFSIGSVAGPEWPGVPINLHVQHLGPLSDRIKDSASKFCKLRRLALEKLHPAEAASAEGSPESATGAFTEPTTGLHFLPVPGGDFMMGDELQKDTPKGVDPEWWKKFRAWASPPHPVQLSPFWLAETSVTNAHYEQFRKSRGGKTKGGSTQRDFILPNQPVVEVSWEEAMEFCSWLNEKSEGGKWRFVLPTEAQREFAARSSDNRPFPWGRDRPPTEKLAVVGGKLSAPARVGSCPDGKGPFGHLDLAGNVWEWCLDPWVEDAYKRRSSDREHPSLDPGSDFEPAAAVRCVRGGAWPLPSAYLRSALRGRYLRTYRGDSLGFRLAAVPSSR